MYPRCGRAGVRATKSEVQHPQPRRFAQGVLARQLGAWQANGTARPPENAEIWTILKSGRATPHHRTEMVSELHGAVTLTCARRWMDCRMQTRPSIFDASRREFPRRPTCSRQPRNFASAASAGSRRRRDDRRRQPYHQFLEPGQAEARPSFGDGRAQHPTGTVVCCRCRRCQCTVACRRTSRYCSECAKHADDSRPYATKIW